MTAQTHWDEVYGRSAITEVSWFQDDPATSIALLAATGAQFPGFEVVRVLRQEHHTPAGRVQPFTWLLLSDRGR